MADDLVLEPVPEDWDRCLAVVAHPDDLEYGMGAALARWTRQGKDVIELLATRGEAGIQGMAPDEARRVRTAEQEAGAAIVGASAVEWLDLPDGTLTAGLGLRRLLAREIRRHRPDVIATIAFGHGFFGMGRTWNHADHRALGESLLDAVRDAANEWVFPELVDEGFAPWDGVRFVAVGSSLDARHYVDVSESIDAGVESLRAHAAYLEALGGVDADAMLRGASAGVGQLVGVANAIAVEVL